MDNLNISYSSSGTLDFCAKKFQLNKMFAQPPRHFESIAMAAGTALHAAFQDFLIHGDLERGLMTLGLAYPHVNCWDSEDDRSWEACMATYLAMVDKASQRDWEVALILHDGIEKPAIEVPFEIVLEGVTLPDGRGVSYIGYIDAVMLHRGSRFGAVDIKTTRDRTRDRTANFKYNEQQVPYGLVIEHLTGDEIKTFQVDYFDAFLDLVEPRVTLLDFDKTREDINHWAISLAARVRNLIYFMQHGVFPRAGHGCVSYNRPCKYFDMCYAEDPETIQSLLLMGEEAAPPREFDPWIKTTIDMTELMK